MHACLHTHRHEQIQGGTRSAIGATWAERGVEQRAAEQRGAERGVEQRGAECGVEQRAALQFQALHGLQSR